MSKRVPSIVLKDIINCIEHIEQYTQGFSFEDFTANFMAKEACLYNIQIIGEAVPISLMILNKKRSKFLGH